VRAQEADHVAVQQVSGALEGDKDVSFERERRSHIRILSVLTDIVKRNKWAAAG